MKENYQKKMEDILKDLPKCSKKKLLLHVCCGPCSSYVLELLKEYFDITLFYYNPNISPIEEWEQREKEVERLVEEMNLSFPVIKASYDASLYEEKIKEYRGDKEGGRRCFICYEMRLDKAAQYAKEKDFDYFTTTLSISPYKNAEKLNEIGKKLEEVYDIPYLYADFKKKNGYKRSIELSSIYHLYRQEYCGCVYSKKERGANVKTKNRTRNISRC